MCNCCIYVNISLVRYRKLINVISYNINDRYRSVALAARLSAVERYLAIYSSRSLICSAEYINSFKFAIELRGRVKLSALFQLWDACLECFVSGLYYTKRAV
jgi:hypothetical protein